MNAQQLNLLESVEDQIKPPIGNTSLVDYGIKNEASDFRAHVAYLAQRVYVFPTACGKSAAIAAEKNGQTPIAVFTGNIKTAEVINVGVSFIDRLHEVVIPLDIYQRHRISPEMSTSLKGQIATSIVAALLERDMIPLPVRLNHADSKALQIAGTDIVINALLHLQVKCDMKGGDRKYGGTGRLCLQLRESNPYQRY